MSVPEETVHEAYQFFLGRPPKSEPLPRVESVPKLLSLLIGSPEFQTSPRARKTPLPWPIAQIFISHPAKVIYCPIGKNACSFMKSQIVRISGIEYADFALHSIHGLTDRVRTGLQLCDYSAEEAAGFLSSPDYFRFAVVRDPADRLLSAYLEKFVLNRKDSGNIFHTGPVVVAVQSGLDMPAPDYERGITFRQFVSHISKNDPAMLDPHWKPQHLYLAGVHYDQLYRFDEIEQLVADLEARSGKTLPRQHENVTARASVIAQPGAADLLPAEIEKLPRLSKLSFFDTSLEGDIRNYFRIDYEILNDLKK